MKEYTLPIIIHLTGALLALGISPIVLIINKGTIAHRWLGRVWAFAVVITALSSFWIHELGGFRGFSWIHILSIYSLWSICAAVYFIRVRNTYQHRRAMLGTFVGLSLAGVLAVLPGRRLGAFLFGW